MTRLGPHSHEAEWMTLDEAAETSGAAPSTIYAAMRRGDLPGLRTAAGEWRVDRAAVAAWPGPARGGRPEVGPAFSLRFPPELLAAVDAQAAEEGTSRAVLIRRLVARGLGLTA